MSGFTDPGERSIIRYILVTIIILWRVCFILRNGLSTLLGEWWVLLEQGFYQSLSLYEQELGLDPHGWLLFLVKGIAIFMWLLVVREVPAKRLLNDETEIRRKKVSYYV